jgi:hypothetical protein
LAIFLKTLLWWFFSIIGHHLRQHRNFFFNCFGKNIFKIITSVPDSTFIMYIRCKQVVCTKAVSNKMQKLEWLCTMRQRFRTNYFGTGNLSEKFATKAEKKNLNTAWATLMCLRRRWTKTGVMFLMAARSLFHISSFHAPLERRMTTPEPSQFCINSIKQRLSIKRPSSRNAPSLEFAGDLTHKSRRKQ